MTTKLDEKSANALGPKKKAKFTPRNSNGGTTSRAFANGRLVQLETSKHGFEFGGHIIIPDLIPETKLGLEFNHDKQGDNSPDFWVHKPVMGREGAYWAKCGSCWIKEPKNGGEDYLSFSLSFVDIGRRIDLQAWRADKEHQPKSWDGVSFPPVWQLSYNLPRSNRSASSNAAAQPLDDEIVY